MHWRGRERRAELCIEFWPIRYLCNYALHHAAPFSPPTIPYFCNYAWQAGTFHPCQFLPRIPPPQNKAHQIASLSKSHQTLYISRNRQCLLGHSTLDYTIHMYYLISMWIHPNVYLLPAECAFWPKILKSRMVLSEARLGISSSWNSAPNTMPYQPNTMPYKALANGAPQMCVDQMGPGHGRPWTVVRQHVVGK